MPQQQQYVNYRREGTASSNTTSSTATSTISGLFSELSQETAEHEVMLLHHYLCSAPSCNQASSSTRLQPRPKTHNNKGGRRAPVKQGRREPVVLNAVPVVRNAVPAVKPAKAAGAGCVASENTNSTSSRSATTLNRRRRQFRSETTVSSVAEDSENDTCTSSEEEEEEDDELERSPRTTNATMRAREKRSLTIGKSIGKHRELGKLDGFNEVKAASKEGLKLLQKKGTPFHKKNSAELLCKHIEFSPFCSGKRKS